MKIPSSAKLRKVTNQIEVETTVRKSVLSGAFACIANVEWRAPSFKLIPFISSTFTDTGYERDFLQDLLLEMRAESREYDIQVIFVDMRWGVRDENTSDHMTWIACSRALEWCKKESLGVFFFSLQADKYGYTPLPKFLSQAALDARLKSLTDTSTDTVNPSTIAAIRHWYVLDENAVPPQYVLRALTDSNSKEYWDAFPRMVDSLKGVYFEGEGFPGLLKVGHSVTEWEVLSAFQTQLQLQHPGQPPADSYSAEVPTINRDLGTSFLWSRRHFAAPPTAEEDPKKLFNDGRDNLVVASHLSALKASMQVLFPSSCVTEHGGLTLSSYRTLDSGDIADLSAQGYLDSFKRFARESLMDSLQSVISLKQRWAEDGCGMGVSGASLAEMLHHCQWARAKCEKFQGREGLVSRALEMVQGAAPQAVETAKHPLRGICMCVIGVSGAGKTALMAKVSDCVFQANQGADCPVPVIVRFCGTSPGSRSARSLICSISEQIELLMGLEHRAAALLASEPFPEQVSYFQQLVHDHPVLLFIDSLDQLTDEDLGRSRISFLRDIVPHQQSRIVVSCLPDEYDAAKQEWKYCYQCETRLREASVQRLVVSMSGGASETTAGEAVDLMRSMLLQQYSRTLTAVQWADVRRKVAVEPTALYLNLAVRVVQLWTSDVHGCDDQSHQLAGGVRPLIERVLVTLERDFGSVLTRAALGFITYAVKGVSDVEMEDLLSMHDAVLDRVFQYATPKIRRLPSHVWLRLKQALSDLIVEGKLGCTTWYHRQLKETAEALFAPEKQFLHAIMGKYFGNLVDASIQGSRKLRVHEWTICGQSPFFKRSVVNTRRCAEGTYHMLAAGMVSEAEEQLCSFECTCSTIRAGEAFQLVRQLIDVTTMAPASSKAQHFLRWLQQDIYFLSKNPISVFLSSALVQPKVSTVRALGEKMAKIFIKRTFLHSVLFATPVGGQMKFAALISALEGHISFVSSVAFSPDGKHIVSGSSDMTVRVWDAATGVNTCSLEGHSAYVCSVAYSPDGKHIVSGSADKTVRVWDAASGAITCTLKRHGDSVRTVAFSPDGKQIVSGSADKTVRVWDAATGANTCTLEGHSSIVSSVAFSSDGKHIVSGSDDTTVRVWDAATGANTCTLEGHSSIVSSVAFSPDGKHIVSGSMDKTVRLWDAATGANTSTLEGHSGRVSSVAYSPDGKLIMTGSEDKTVRVWDVATGANTYTLEGHSAAVCSVAFSPNGKHIVSGSRDRTVCVWDADTAINTCKQEGHSGQVTTVAFSPDGKHIVSGSMDKTVRVWDAATGANTFTLDGHSAYVWSVAFSPDGKHIVSGSDDKTVRVWDVATGANTCTLEGHSGRVFSVAFSPDGKHIMTGSDDKTVRVWDAATGVNTCTLEGHSAAIRTVAFSPDGKHIVSGSMDKTVRVWDAATGANTSTLKGHRGYVFSVAYSPDGKHVVTGSLDQIVRVWDVATGTNTCSMEGHSTDSSVCSVAFSPDGKHIVSGSADKTVRLWDAATGANTCTLEGHSSIVSSVAFSSDGKLIVSGSKDKTVRVWNGWRDGFCA